MNVHTIHIEKTQPFYSGHVETVVFELCSSPNDYRAYVVEVIDRRAGAKSHTHTRVKVAEMDYYSYDMKQAAADARELARELSKKRWPHPVFGDI